MKPGGGKDNPRRQFVDTAANVPLGADDGCGGIMAVSTIDAQLRHRFDQPQGGNNNGKVEIDELPSVARENLKYVREHRPDMFDKFDGDIGAWIKKQKPAAWKAAETHDAGVPSKVGGGLSLWASSATVGVLCGVVGAGLLVGGPLIIFVAAMIALALTLAIVGGWLIGKGFSDDDDEAVEMVEKAAQDLAAQVRAEEDKKEEARLRKEAREARDNELDEARRADADRQAAYRAGFKYEETGETTLYVRGREVKVKLRIVERYTETTLFWDKEGSDALRAKLDHAGVPKKKIDGIIAQGERAILTVKHDAPESAHEQYFADALKQASAENQLFFFAASGDLSDEQLFRVADVLAPLPDDATIVQKQERDARISAMLVELLPEAGDKPAQLTPTRAQGSPPQAVRPGVTPAARQPRGANGAIDALQPPK